MLKICIKHLFKQFYSKIQLKSFKNLIRIRKDIVRKNRKKCRIPKTNQRIKLLDYQTQPDQTSFPNQHTTLWLILTQYTLKTTRTLEVSPLLKTYITLSLSLCFLRMIVVINIRDVLISEQTNKLNIFETTIYPARNSIKSSLLQYLNI